MDSLEKMIQDKKEYTLLDEQKVIAEAVKNEAKLAFTTNQKKGYHCKRRTWYW